MRTRCDGTRLGGRRGFRLGRRETATVEAEESTQESPEQADLDAAPIG
jgi:hypothetical protein